MLSRQRAFFIRCQKRDSNSLLSVHKPATLVTQNVILTGSVASEKNLFKYVGGSKLTDHGALAFRFAWEIKSVRILALTDSTSMHF